MNKNNIHDEIRKIKFGIRLKFSLVMIAGILFASGFLGIAMYNQNKKNIKETMFHSSNIFLQGIEKDSRKYFKNKKKLASVNYNKEKARAGKKYRKKIVEAKKDMESQLGDILKVEFFSKNRILDSPFLIDFNWNNIDKSINRDIKTYHIDVKGVKKHGYIFRHGKDPEWLLVQTIYHYFMNNIKPESHLYQTDILNNKRLQSLTGNQDKGLYTFISKKVREKNKDFLVIGKPVFKRNQDRNLYSYYNDHKTLSLTKKDEQFKINFNNFGKNTWKRKLKENETEEKIVENNRGNEKKFRKIFISRMINNRLNFNYIINFTNDKNQEKELKKRKRLYSFFNIYYDLRKLKRNQRKELKKEFYELKLNDENSITINKYKEFVKRIQRTYNIKAKYKKNKRSKLNKEKLWIKFHNYLIASKISVTSELDTDTLALYSFRKDIIGITGFYLYRDKYYKGVAHNRKNIIDLILSILLRVIIIALFFPTFLIRSIQKISEGADAISRGNFDKKITLRGSDEIGRLSDVLNKMTSSLKEGLRMQGELKTAELIQSTLLPEKLPEITGMEFGAYYSAQSESGGDYYDIIELPDNRLGVTIADVSGHGVGSGLVMAMTRTLLHVYCKKVTDIKKIFEAMNEYLHANTASNFFVTMFYGVLDLNDYTFKFISAGHNEGVILKKNGNVELLPSGGIALGATSNTTFSPIAQVKKVTLEKGDYFIQATDGIDEAMNASEEEYGLDRFYSVLKKNYGKSPENMIKAVEKDLNKFTGGLSQSDDIALIIFKIT